jgi:hypothetical protein
VSLMVVAVFAMLALVLLSAEVTWEGAFRVST